MALVPIMNWVQFNSLGGVVSRTVAEQFGRGILVKFGQLHPAFVAFAAGTRVKMKTGNQYVMIR